MREEGYRSLQIRKSALAALESTEVRLSVSALTIYRPSRNQRKVGPRLPGPGSLNRVESLLGGRMSQQRYPL